MRSPTRPRRRTSPKPTTPSTRAENTSGTTTMVMRRRKTLPTESVTLKVTQSTRSCMPLPSASRRFGTPGMTVWLKTKLAVSPARVPTAIPIRMRVCSGLPRRAPRPLEGRPTASALSACSTISLSRLLKNEIVQRAAPASCRSTRGWKPVPHPIQRAGYSGFPFRVASRHIRGVGPGIKGCVAHQGRRYGKTENAVTGNASRSVMHRVRCMTLGCPVTLRFRGESASSRSSATRR